MDTLANMPRNARAIEAGLIYHVLNRGNGQMRLFHKPEDYAAFERVLAEGLARYPSDLLTYCIMPNHWHLVARPLDAVALGRWLGWVGVTHVRRHHEHYHRRGGGHWYQSHYKSFPVQSDKHFLALCRYVEANPRNAQLDERAKHWQWRGGARRLRLARCPTDWIKRVNRSLPRATLEELWESVQRGRPRGDPAWISHTANRLYLGFTLRGPGRPPKQS